MPPNGNCPPPNGAFTFSLDQLYNATSLQWSASLSVTQNLTVNLSWTLSDKQGQLASDPVETVGVTTARAPVGTPTLSISGHVLQQTGCYEPIQENLTGTH
jgi:hypothetical protein